MHTTGFSRRFLRRSLGICAVAFGLLSACAAPPLPPDATQPEGWPQSLSALMPADVLLLGEQHDAAAHHAMETSAVQWLAGQRRLAALVIEMAPAGGSTVGLPTSASASEVRAALQWNDLQWPWDDYAGPVMAAVRAGAPVLGGNLPLSAMRSSMQLEWLDSVLSASAYAAQLTAVREGHCDLLPESQLPGMVRIQIARDQSMARVIAAAAKTRAPGSTVLLVAGGGHVLRNRGVPVHLPKDLVSKVVLAQSGSGLAAMESEADSIQLTPALPERDVCAPLRAGQGTMPAARP